MPVTTRSRAFLVRGIYEGLESLAHGYCQYPDSGDAGVAVGVNVLVPSFGVMVKNLLATR